MTIRSLLDWLGIGGVSPQRLDYEQCRARMVMAQAAMRAAEALGNESILIEVVSDRLQTIFQGDRDQF